MKTIAPRSRSFLAATLVALVGLTAIGCGGSDEETAPSAPTSAPTGTGSETPSGGNPQTPGDPAPAPAPAADGPYVVSTLPANGAKAVKSDANVVVKFDRPMDTASVIAAYSSVELAADKVTFEWNGNDTELTIKPKAPLAYAAGAADVVAKSYAIEISTAAKDKAGLSLLKVHASSFATARRITTNVPMTSVMTGRALSNNTFSSSNLGAGDIMTGDGEREARAVFTFLFSAVLPDGADIEKATLLAAVSKIDGTPDASLGAVTAEQIFYSTGLEGFAAEPVAGVPTSLTLVFLGQDEPSYRKADVTAMFMDDVANRIARSDRTQYRLRYTNGQNNDAAADLVTYDKSLTKLQIVYVIE